MINGINAATIENLHEILDFENGRLKEMYPSEIEQSMVRWSSPWRQESLEHYLKTGWSFVLRNPELAIEAQPLGPLIGYFLAQPLLFLDGQTQSLWVEHIGFTQEGDRDQLCEFAYRLAREKHLQKVYLPGENNVHNKVSSYKATPWTPQVVQVLTTKVQS